MKRLSLLIVDHSQNLIKSWEKLLLPIAQKLEIMKARNSSDAVKIIETTPPQFVFIDGNLNDNKSFWLLQTIKQDHPEIKVIMLLNYQNELLKRLCRKFKADYCFDKYHDMEKIIRLIQSQKM